MRRLAELGGGGGTQKYRHDITFYAIYDSTYALTVCVSTITDRDTPFTKTDLPASVKMLGVIQHTRNNAIIETGGFIILEDRGDQYRVNVQSGIGVWSRNIDKALIYEFPLAEFDTVTPL